MMMFRQALARALACAALFTVAACSTTVDISARFPPRYAETANLRKIAVANFDGYGGPEFQAVLRNELYSAQFDGQTYFNVVAGGGPADPGAAAAFGRSVGAQAVILGTVGSDFRTDQYQGSEQRCVDKDGDKCRKYKSFPIPCWRRNVDLMVTPSLVNVASGRVVYSAQKRAHREASWCANQTPPGSDLDLVSDAQREIASDIRRDIAPYNTTLSATLKTKGEGLSADLKTRFAAAVKSASSGDMGGACEAWKAIDAAQPGNLDTVYDLGVCFESAGDYPRALTQYRKAQGLAPADKEVGASLNRASNLLDAQNALKRNAGARR